MSARSSTQPYGPQNLTANGQTVGPVDTADFEYIAIQIGAVALVGTIVFEQSLDGIVWTGCALQRLDSTNSNVVNTLVNPGTSLIYYGPCPGKFFRVRSTAYTSGSTNITILPVEGSVAQLIFNNAVGGSTTPADAQANPTTAVIEEAFNMAFNNTTWDRLRNATGIAGAGGLGSSLAVASGSYTKVSHAAATTVVAGGALDGALARKDHSLHVTGTGVGATVTLEGSLDNATWFPLPLTAPVGGGGTIAANAGTTNGYYTAVGAVRSIRANITAITSGAVTTNIASA